MKINGHKVIFRTVVGSHAYGTNIEGSDIDYKGVFVQEPMDILVNGVIKQINVTDDEVYYEISRFLELLNSNNPTILEMLFVDEKFIDVLEDEFKDVLDNRLKFITKKAKFSFAGYSASQIKKARGLNKKINWDEADMKRKSVLDFCYFNIPSSFSGSITLNKFLEIFKVTQEQIGLSKIPNMRDCYQVYIDKDKVFSKGIVSDENKANDVRLSSIPKGSISIAIMSFNIDGYKMHCRKYKEYLKWKEMRNEQRYVENKESMQKYDGKNMMHCVRLVETAKDIALGKGVVVYRPNAKYLLDIRKGKVSLDEILSHVETTMTEIDEAMEGSNLPSSIESGLIEGLLYNIRKKQLSYD